MIYLLYHILTDTRMNENGLPGYSDVLGGLSDVIVTAGIIYAVTVVL